MLKIEIWPIEKLRPYERNPRKNDPAVDQMVKSIKEYGFRIPVVAQSSGEIVDGHLRFKAAVKLKMKKIPVALADELTPTQVRGFRILANKSANWAAWDTNLLKEELNELHKMDFDLSLTGFAAGELDHLLKFGTSADGENSTPEIPDNPITQPGDVWLLGPHRVICGDSTDPETVKKLLGKDEPRLMVTDPPYGVEYDASWRSADNGINSKGSVTRKGTVKNDDRADWREAWELFPGNVAYIWHGGLHAGIVQESLTAVGFKMRAQIIWLKQKIVFGRGDYHWQHEPCWYAVRDTGNWCGDRKQSTIWEIENLNHQSSQGKENSFTEHSTQKLVECMRRPMLNNSSPGDFVYDPFLGSGTTVIAAETIGRICLGIELNPAYVDVIVKRWQEMTGKKAVHAETGEAFDAA